MSIPEKVAILGSGSWATAIAKIVQQNGAVMYWHMRSQERIDAFKAQGHNPAYLSSVKFDIEKIHFTTDINAAIKACQMVIFAMPSPYLRDNVEQINCDCSGKVVISVIKGIVHIIDIGTRLQPIDALPYLFQLIVHRLLHVEVVLLAGELADIDLFVLAEVFAFSVQIAVIAFGGPCGPDVEGSGYDGEINLADFCAD